jgi:CO/xanthine dehydrogenase FAD-binding subunit
MIEKIIERARPDAILPTLGGQTGLNAAVFLARAGVFKKYNVEVLGSSTEAIARAAEVAAGEIKPIDDVHGTAWYRTKTIKVLVERTLRQAGGLKEGAK